MTDYPYYRSKRAYDIMQAAYDENIKSWPVQPESRYIETKMGKTHLLIVGDENSPPLFYFHGWNGNASGNHEELDLARLIQHYRVFMPDVPGHTGRSEQVRADTKTIAYAEWVREMLDKLDIERVYLAGVSGGGYVMCKAVAHLGERVIRALGIVPHGIPPSALPPLRCFMVAIPGMMMGEPGVRRFVRKMGSPVKQIDQDSFVKFMLLMSKHFKPAGNPAPLSDEELKSITCPFTVLLGKYDITMKTGITAERARRLITHSDVRMLDDEGHIFSSDGWRIVNDILCEWIEAT